jgi:hypothetical protein
MQIKPNIIAQDNFKPLQIVTYRDNKKVTCLFDRDQPIKTLGNKYLN